jgi:hypothetical protein
MIEVVNGKLFVEKLAKRKKEETTNSFSSFGQFLDADNNMGTILMLEETATALKYGIKEGCTVYFGNKVEKIFLGGREVLVMEFDNVLAVVRSDENA